MGADLYINKVFKKNQAKYEKLFADAVEKRNALQPGAAHDEAQKEVSKWYNKMYEVGYFRDSYNDSSLFWQFGLSWWSDVVPMCKRGKLSPAKALELLAMCKAHESTFEINMRKAHAEGDMSKEEVVKYFRDKYEAFKAFINEAVNTNSSIDASL